MLMNSCSEMWRRESETSALPLYLSLCPLTSVLPLFLWGISRLSRQFIHSSPVSAKNPTVNTQHFIMHTNFEYTKQTTSTSNKIFIITHFTLATLITMTIMNNSCCTLNYLFLNTIIHIMVKIYNIVIYSHSYLYLGICI